MSTTKIYLILMMSLTYSCNVFAETLDKWGFTENDYKEIAAELRMNGVAPYLKELRDATVNTLPKKTDKNTTLTGVYSSGNIIRHEYFVDINSAVSDLQSMTDKKINKDKFIYLLSNPYPFGYTNICKGNPVLKMLVEHGASFRSILRDMRGGDVVVDDVISSCNIKINKKQI